MNAFMMWMSGDQVGLYSVMMVGYMTWGPIQGLMATNQRFAHLGECQVPAKQHANAGNRVLVCKKCDFQRYADHEPIACISAPGSELQHRRRLT